MYSTHLEIIQIYAIDYLLVIAKKPKVMCKSLGASMIVIIWDLSYIIITFGEYLKYT